MQSTELEQVDETISNQKTCFGYPISALIISWNGFCDRFCYFGIRAILILYLVNVLAFSSDDSTLIYHLFLGFCTMFPVFGAIIGDSSFGKYKTVLIFTIVYILGSLLLTIATTPPLKSVQTELTLFSLVLLAIGTGFVKPCVVAMGGDQFILPHQESQLKSYFSLFYFAINAGSLTSTFMEPILRKDVSCFGGDCYFLAYTVNTSVLLLALISFVAGTKLYKTTARQNDGNGKGRNNSIITVFQCIGHALKMKWKLCGKKTEEEIPIMSKSKLKKRLSTRHWLDYASDKFEEEQIEEIKAVLKVLLFYLFFPLFWSLMEQEGSRWVLQASQTNGNVFGYTLKPEQFQVVNPLLILALIPIFDKLYPILATYNILSKPLHRIATGGILAAVSFAISGVIQLHLENTSVPGDPPSFHMLWLLPQYCLLAVAEVFFAITGMEFSYSQAPLSMKSMMQSAWLLTISGGNLIVAAVTKANLFDSQSNEYFFYSLLMFIDIIILIGLVRKSYIQEMNEVSEMISQVVDDDDDETEKDEYVLEESRRKIEENVKDVALFFAAETS